MKKFFAATMLAIYLFSIGGQLMMHQYFSYLSDRYFEAQTDKGLYNVSDLFEVKLPVKLGQITEWKGYENIAGQIEFENISYNYVKMKLTRNAIYLMCVPNYKTTHVTGQNVICAKDLKSNPVEPKNHVPPGKFVLFSQLSPKGISFEFKSPEILRISSIVYHTEQLPYHTPAMPDRPPRAVC